MDIQKEREAFQNFCEQNFDVERHEQTYFDEQTQSYENDLGECTESVNMAWSAWQTAKAQAVPEGFVLVSMDRLTNVVNGIEALFEEDPTLALGELLPIQQDLKAMIEAQEQSHD